MPLSLKDLERLGAEREAFILAREKALKKTVDEMQRLLLSAIYDELLAKLTTLDGNIVDNDNNISLVGAVDKIYKRFQGQYYKDVIGQYSKDITNIYNRTADYFKPFTGDRALFKRVNTKVKDTMSTLIGINGEGGLVSGGFLDNFAKDLTVRNQLKNNMLKAVVGGAGYEQTLKDTKLFIVGKDPEAFDGALHKHLRQYVYDTYSQFDRTASDAFATELDLQCAVLAGTIMDTTRQWCRLHVGKVYTRKEITAWQSKSWAGKNSPYNPFRDAGGYNCRHHWNWITNEMAIELRPELEEELGQPKSKVVAIKDYTGNGSYNLVVDNEAKKQLRQLRLKPNDVIKISGGVFYPESKGQINIAYKFGEFRVYHAFDEYVMNRTLDFNNGRIYNSYFKAKTRGGGLGPNMVANEIIYGRQYGFKQIDTFAAQDEEEFIGYHVWPSLGFSFKNEASFLNWAKANERPERSIRELLSSDEGYLYWKENGISFDATFDLSDDSINIIDFLRYLQKRNS